MSRPVYLPSMLASAIKHYENVDGWVRIRVRMKDRPGPSLVRVVLFTSSKKDKDGRPLSYRTSEHDCSCPGFTYHGGVCAHWLAVRMDIEQARRRAIPRPRREQPSPELDEVF